jgi:hypothetical protein
MSGYFSYDNINKMHIELSSVCNSICPNCPRYFQNSPNVIPELYPQSITIEKFKEWFPRETLMKMKQILFCGNHGDPGSCKDLVPILEYVFDNTKYYCGVQMHTNGGMKQPKIWDKIGMLFAKRPESWKMIFSIDGLEDTNHIYRRNVNWDKLMANVKAYTKHEGNSDWEFLIFKHNELQVKAAKEMSIQLGIKQFSPKKAHGLDDGNNHATMPALNKEGKTEYQIYPPTEQKDKVNYIKTTNTDIITTKNKEFDKVTMPDNTHRHRYIEGTVGLTRVKQHHLEEWDNTPIRPRCYREVYVSASGFVTPCCWIGIIIPFIDKSEKTSITFKTHQLKEKMLKLGLDNFNLHNISLKELLDTGLLNKVYSDDWDKTTANGKLALCTETCGKANVLDDTMSHEDNPYKKTRKSTDHREHLA